MLLSQIITDPNVYQFRDTPFSAKTVAAIVAEGIDLAKFDPLPLVSAGEGLYCVAGDGHSRYEAIRRLADQARLPEEWLVDADAGEWNIPHRLVTRGEARKLAWTANLSRDNFGPCEEAKVFQSMLDDGLTMAEVAKIAHKDPAHVTRLLSLNSLCRDIRAAVGASPAAGGIDVLTAQVLATGFKRYGIEPQQQQQLWHCFLKSAMLNFQSAKRFVDRIGSRLGQKKADGLLFELPANAAAVLEEAKAKGNACRSAKMGLALLMKARDAGGLEDLPELAAWLQAHGQSAMAHLSDQVTADGDALADLVAPPKFFQPRPMDEAERRIARQYDPKATPTMFAG